MAINATQNENVPAFAFPKLMKFSASKLVVLAKAEDNGRLRGIVLVPDGNNELGDSFNDFVSSKFSDYHGSVTLNNK